VHRENLEKHPEKIGDDVRKRLENAKKATVAMYIQALQKRVVLRRMAEALFQPFDGLLLPGYPCVAAPIETAVGTVNGKESSFLGMGRPLTGPHNFTGFPVLMVPTGFSPAAGLPMEIRSWASQAPRRGFCASPMPMSRPHPRCETGFPNCWVRRIEKGLEIFYFFRLAGRK